MVSVRFVTRVPSLPVVPDTFIQLPTSLARYGLSEIVNHLASIGKDKQRIKQTTSKTNKQTERERERERAETFFETKCHRRECIQ